MTFIHNSGVSAELIIDRSISTDGMIHESGLFVWIYSPKNGLLWHPFTEVSTEYGGEQLNIFLKFKWNVMLKLFQLLD